MEITQYDVYLVALYPTIGSKLQKTRPAVIISPVEMNDNLNIIIIAPLTTKSHNYPTRVKTKFDSKDCFIVLDQIRTIDKVRLIKKMGAMDIKTISKIKNTIQIMLVD